MFVRCPHCEHDIDLTGSTQFDNISCGSCGCQFCLVDDTDSDTAANQAPKRLGRFELLESLGQGGQGTVWKARDTQLERTVAIKVPRRNHGSLSDGESFLREAKAAAQIRHPNIVAVHEIGREGETIFIVSDFVEGTTLTDWMTKNRPSFQDIARLCVKLTDALEHAHSAGIVHRDLKPSNIMIDAANEPHIMDFGLAKRAAPDVTVTVNGFVMGTPAYMSPEQARGEADATDVRSDIYSLGVILFELLTGERPFRGNHRMLLQQVIGSDPPLPHTLNGNVPEDLETISLKCLEKNPTQRFQSARELGDEFRRYLRGEPIHSRRITRATRAWRWCKRNPVISGLSAGLLAALLIGLVGVTTQWWRAENYAKQATDEAGRATSEAERARTSAENERAAKQRLARHLYGANMNLTQQAYELSDPDRMRDLLERHLPSREEDDLRGFEWFYWWRQCHRWTRSFDEHTAPVYATSASPIQPIAASGGRDRTVKLWNIHSGETIATLENKGQVFSVAFSPDGKTLAVGGDDKQIKLWNVDSREVVATLVGHTGTVFALAYSQDGGQIVSASSDTTVRVWDVAKKESLHVWKGHFDFVYTVAIAADGKMVASAGLDRTIRLWNMETGESRELRGHAIEVWHVAFSHDGKTLASASGDRTIRLWDLESGETVATLAGHTDRVRSVCYLPDDNTLISTGDDRTVRLWDLTLDDPSNDVAVRKLNRRPVHFFERINTQSRKLRQTLTGHSSAVNSLTLVPDGTLAITSSEDRTVKVWELGELREPDLLRSHDRSVTSVSFTTDGQTLLTASNDKSVRLWNVASGEEIGSPMWHEDQVWAAALSPDSKHVASGSTDGRVSIWNLETRERTILGRHGGPVAGVAFSPDGKKIASASHDRLVKIWDWKSGDELQSCAGHEGQVYAVLFLRGGKELASCSADGSIKFWNVENGSLIRSIAAHRGTVWCLSLSNDGKSLASGGEDRAIKLWDVETASVQKTFLGHAAFVQSVAFAPDGMTLASGGGDKMVKLWDLQTGEQKTTLKGHEYRVWSLAFTPDGQLLASGSYELSFWRAPQNYPPADKSASK